MGETVEEVVAVVVGAVVVIPFVREVVVVEEEGGSGVARPPVAHPSVCPHQARTVVVVGEEVGDHPHMGCSRDHPDLVAEEEEAVPKVEEVGDPGGIIIITGEICPLREALLWVPLVAGVCHLPVWVVAVGGALWATCPLWVAAAAVVVARHLVIVVVEEVALINNNNTTTRVVKDTQWAAVVVVVVT